MKKINKAVKKGFTLIELLVVIAILAVLAVVVVLTLNPAGLLAEARDSNRISDMATLKSALSLYLADVAPVSLGAPGTCYVSLATTTGNGMIVPISKSTTQPTSTCISWFSQQTVATSSVNPMATTSRSDAGTGWIPVNFNLISAGAPFALEPVDPVNTSSSFYSYEASSTVFKIGMFMESSKYEASGTADVVSTDGGYNNFIFEGGSNLTM